MGLETRLAGISRRSTRSGHRQQQARPQQKQAIGNAGSLQAPPRRTRTKEGAAHIALNAAPGLQFQIRKPSRAPTRRPEPGRSGLIAATANTTAEQPATRPFEAIHVKLRS